MRRSDQDSDGTTWAPVSLRVGSMGLDLRRPGDPASLTECLNARFLDEKTLTRRDGHLGYPVRTGAAYSSGTHGDWVYGHGNRTVPGDSNANPRTYVPRHRRAGLTFNLDGTDVVWTGDRLVVMRGNVGIGASDFWDKDSSAPTALDRGIPAFLPVMTDTPVPFGVDGTVDMVALETTAQIETALTPTLRVYGQISGGSVILYVIDRVTGARIDATDLAVTGCTRLRVLSSNGTPVALYLDGADIKVTHWTGVAWSTPSTVQASVDYYDVCVVNDGFHVVWRVGTAIYAGRYFGATASDTPYVFGVDLSALYASELWSSISQVAVAQAPTGEMALAVATTDGLFVRQFTEGFADNSSGDPWAGVVVTDTMAVCIVARGLAAAPGAIRWVVHYARLSHDDGVGAFTYLAGDVFAETRRRNATLASRSFVVGDEVFVWVNSSYTYTLFLMAGTGNPVVAGYADREVALVRDITGTGTPWLPLVTPDPLDEYAFTWVRPYLTGVDHAHPGNARTGDIQFLPQPTAARFGESIYISGSAVKNWDGVRLADAGFQEYPVIGSVTAGVHGVLVRAVRYNARGERFESAALPTTATATGSKTLLVRINTLPGVSTTDVVFEVYMTTAGGAAYYYVGSVANTFDAAYVDYTVNIADASLDDRRGDPFYPAVGVLPEVENFGPVGCSLLVAAGDRLYGAGGQVPAGQVIFSKRWTANAGAGFDTLAGYQVVDAEGGGITSIANFFDSLAVFQDRRIFLLLGPGPDNFGQGSFEAPQAIMTDGALTHFGTASCQLGVLFWGQGGPRLLAPNQRVTPICEPVYPLANTLNPTGVRVDLSRREVVWYTAEGDALLFNYAGAQPRWARWNGLHIASVSDAALVTTDGVLLVPTPDVGDNGARFTFAFATGLLAPSDLLQGGVRARRVGLVGEYGGPHTLRLRVFYDGSPLWAENAEWEPDADTWLVLSNDIGDLTPAQIDALTNTDRSGRYAFHKRLERQTCNHFRVYVSDRGSDGPTFTPYALSFELGAKPGLGRTPVATIGD